MPDFVTPDCELTTGEIAALTRAKLREGDPADRRIRNIAPLDTAGPADLSFLDNSKYLSRRFGDARRRLFCRAALCRFVAAGRRRARGRASLSGFRRGDAQALP